MRLTILTLALAAAPASASDPSHGEATPPAEKAHDAHGKAAKAPAADAHGAHAGEGKNEPGSGKPEPGTGSAKKLPPFAAELAQMPMIAGDDGWHGKTGAAAWKALTMAAPEKRQATRWNFVLGSIAAERGAEALGVLDVMAGADEDLALVGAYRLARGAALTLQGRTLDAVAALAVPELAHNAEACAWRVRALMQADSSADALREINCAIPAINARAPAERAPFVLAASRAAIDTGHAGSALTWLKLFPDQDPAANVLRGRALLAQGDKARGRLRLERAELSGTPEVRADARLGVIQANVAAHSIAPDKAVAALEALRFRWRGGLVEKHALQLELKLASEARDLNGTLRAGATLFRYFALGRDASPMLAMLQNALSDALAIDSRVPLTEAAGLYWQYRELSPAGAQGDALVLRLAERLRAVGLYARAAELLQYQLTQRMRDLAQGPMSVRVAELHILSNRPDKALEALRATEQPEYPAAMRADRKRIEAIALHLAGKNDAALAALDGIADADAIRAEIHWSAKDWGKFAGENAAALPAAVLDESDQAIVLRQAIALAMLGREPQLAALRTRYAASFAKVPGGKAFDMLTRKVDEIDPAAIGAAMAAIPDTRPAGTIGALLGTGA